MTTEKHIEKTAQGEQRMISYILWWVSPDKQSTLDMGWHETHEEAAAAIPEARRQIADEGGDPAGTFSIETFDDRFERSAND